MKIEKIVGFSDEMVCVFKMGRKFGKYIFRVSFFMYIASMVRGACTARIEKCFADTVSRYSYACSYRRR